MTRRRRTPWWVWALIVALGLIPLAQHVWVAAFPPEGTVHTGLHLLDTVFFLHAMRMVDTDFYSPYASCRSPWGSHDARFFPLTDNWLYWAVGKAGRLAGSTDFFTLGIANALGAMLFYASMYCFLCAAMRRGARLAFALYMLGGGLGGVLFIGAAALGLLQHPMFETYFLRYAKYELIEGAYLAPTLVAPRLYYTVSLAAGYTALALVIRGRRDSAAGAKRLALAAALFFGGTLLNLRFGVVLCGVSLLFLASRLDRRSLGWTVRAAAVTGLAAFAGAALASTLLARAPHLVATYTVIAREAMWLSPFLSAAFFYLFLVPVPAYCAAGRLPRWLRPLAFGAATYFLAYCVLYAGYQAYYGNLWRCLDVTVAIRMCDWALLAIPMGLAYGWWVRRSDEARYPAELNWVALWLALFVAVSISAVGQGWFLRFAPRRLMPFIGPPLAMLAAAWLTWWWARGRRRIVAGAVVTVLVFGVSSIAVASLYFQGSLGRYPGRGPFAGTYHAHMSVEDAAMLEQMDAGWVLAPPESAPSFGDIVTVTPGLPTVYGVGSLNYSDQPLLPMLDASKTFFTPGTEPAFRRDFLETWCVRYVLCPHAPPVDAEVVAALEAMPALRVVAAEGRARLFETRRPEAGSLP